MILTEKQFNNLSLQRKAICGKFEKNNCLGCPFGPSPDVDFPQACGISFASIQVLEDVYNRYFLGETKNVKIWDSKSSKI